MGFKVSLSTCINTIYAMFWSFPHQFLGMTEPAEDAPFIILSPVTNEHKKLENWTMMSNITLFLFL